MASRVIHECTVLLIGQVEEGVKCVTACELLIPVIEAYKDLPNYYMDRLLVFKGSYVRYCTRICQ